jgi:uncharacterized membrane protein (TIGR02234 family)
VTDAVTGDEPAGSRRAGGRRLALLLIFVGAALVLVAATRVWARIEVPAIAGMPSLTVSGRRAAPAGVPIALASAAAAFVLVLSARAVRFLVGLGLLLAGSYLALNSIQVSQDTATQLANAMRDSLGLFSSRSALGATAFGASFGGARSVLTIWPWVAATGGGLIGLAGLLVVVRGSSWVAPGARFEREPTGAVGGATPGVTATAPASSGSSTQDRSAARTTPGTSATVGPVSGNVGPVTSTGLGSGAQAWDALSRGEDPT